MHSNKWSLLLNVGSIHKLFSFAQLSFNEISFSIMTFSDRLKVTSLNFYSVCVGGVRWASERVGVTQFRDIFFS